MIFKVSNLRKTFLYFVQGPKFYGDPPQMPAQPEIPATTTSNINSIPEQLMPNVKTLLGAADKQIYQTNAQGQVTGFQPYVPYSTNAGDYIAPFSPLQQQAQQGAANLQTPGQFAPASQLAGIGGIGSMLAGQNYQNQATDPNSLSAYMSPFMQNVMQQQGRELNRNYDISGTQQQGAATQAGAFGGSREALMASENERNRNMALNKMQAEGLQNAYTAANTNQQFGANLGLQGMGQGVTAAGQLGNLGTAQLGAQTSVLGTQSQFGGQQQTQQQNAINQAVLDYQNAQQYPYMQMGTMSDLLRGTPLRSAGDVTYQAQPSALTQGIGTIGSLGAAYMGMQNRKEGGIIQEKGYANGGIVGYKEGTIVKDDVEGRTRKYLENLDQSQLAEFIQTSPSEEASAIAKEIYQTNSTAGTMAPPIQQTAGTQMAAKGGIMGYKGGEGIEDEFEGVGVKEGNLHSLLHGKGMKYSAMPSDKNRRQVEYATGGIVAFKKGGLPETEVTKDKGIFGEIAPEVKEDVEKDVAEEVPTKKDDSYIANLLGTATKTAEATSPVHDVDWYKNVRDKALADAGVKPANELYDQDRARLEKEKASIEKDQTSENWMTVSKIFANWGRTPGPVLAAGLNALSTSIPDFIQSAKDKKKFAKAIADSESLLNHAENAEKRGDTEKAFADRDAASSRMLDERKIIIAAKQNQEGLVAKAEEGRLDRASEEERTRITANRAQKDTSQMTGTAMLAAKTEALKMARAEVAAGNNSEYDSATTDEGRAAVVDRIAEGIMVSQGILPPPPPKPIDNVAAAKAEQAIREKAKQEKLKSQRG